MKNGAYLSDAISLDSLTEDALNLIEAPCGSGKTTFMTDVLPTHSTFWK